MDDSEAHPPPLMGRLRVACALLKDACRLLRVGPGVAATGALFLSRLFGGDSPLTGQPPAQAAAACLFLACKVEECPPRVSDLVNVFRCLVHTRDGPSMLSLRLAALASSGPSPDFGPGLWLRQGSPPGVLVGEDYHAAKESLLEDEAELLRALRYHLPSDPPHRQLMNLLRWVAAPPAVAQLSVALLNAAVESGGTLAQRRGPDLLAGAALHLAEAILQSAPQEGAADWRAAASLSRPAVEEAAADILLVACPELKIPSGRAGGIG